MRYTMTQEQHFWRAHRNISDGNEMFLNMVKDGMTKKELEILIEKRPNMYSRFKNWLEKLPN
jgi:hypothetical protein